MPAEVGSQAPDFSLPNQHREVVSLSDFRGRQAVLLVFYPFAFSGICTGELCELRDDLAPFEDASVQVLGISADNVHVLRAFAEAQGYSFPLLSDFWPHGAVAESYGVFNSDAGAANRGTFLIDKDGIIRFAEANGIGDARDQQGWRDALRDLAA